MQVEPLIQKENLGIVHHILVYGCFDNIDREHYFTSNKTGYDCFEGNMPRDMDACRAPINAWAIGGDVCAFLLYLFFMNPSLGGSD